MHPAVELRLAGFVLVAVGADTLGDHLGEWFADGAADKEEQSADAVDQGVTRQQEPRIRRGDCDATSRCAPFVAANLRASLADSLLLPVGGCAVRAHPPDAPPEKFLMRSGPPPIF